MITTDELGYGPEDADRDQERAILDDHRNGHHDETAHGGCKLCPEIEDPKPTSTTDKFCVECGQDISQYSVNGKYCDNVCMSDHYRKREAATRRGYAYNKARFGRR